MCLFNTWSPSSFKNEKKNRLGVASICISFNKMDIELCVLFLNVLLGW